MISVYDLDSNFKIIRIYSGKLTMSFNSAYCRRGAETKIDLRSWQHWIKKICMRSYIGKYGGINEYVLTESSVKSQLLYLAQVYMQ